MVSADREQGIIMFDNPFRITDLMVFDDSALKHILSPEGFGLSAEVLARSVRGVPHSLARRVQRFLPYQQRCLFQRTLRQTISEKMVEVARQQVLNTLFWELTYWKTPQLYEELTQGEAIHPDIFRRLEPDMRGKVLLDAGAGSGRATFECLRHGACRIYAVEPSPGLLQILEQKLQHQPQSTAIHPCRGRFNALPLQENSVDTSLSCSAFTALREQGGEAGLAELQRVTRPGGKIIVIWPRVEDQSWLIDHGFQFVSIPLYQEMQVNFRSWQSAFQCAQRFYAQNQAVLQYLLSHQEASIPFSVLGMNPPHEYCWLEVKKDQ